MTDPARKAELRASLMLVLVTVVWGTSFTFSHGWQQAAKASGIGPLLSGLTLIALRMPLALVLLGVCQPGVVLKPTRQEDKAGLILGAVFFVGFALQTWGLGYTTPALSAFFTSLCSAWVPVLGFLFLGQRVAPLTLAGLAVAMGGCAVLVDGWAVDYGVLLTIISSVVFAVQMLVLDHVGKRHEPAHLTAGFLVATGGLAAVGAGAVAVVTCGVHEWLAWLGGMMTRLDMVTSVACLAFFCTAIGFHWMNAYQPLVSPTRAALIYLLEAIFSAAVSIAWGIEPLTRALVLGGVLILGGNVLVELPRLIPLWRRADRSNADE